MSPSEENNPQPALPREPGVKENEAVLAGLQKAMEQLVKAQDHVNSARDKGSEATSKALAGIIHKIREVQRELSNAIHNAGCGR
jgi:hypothetical protein